MRTRLLSEVWQDPRCCVSSGVDAQDAASQSHFFSTLYRAAWPLNTQKDPLPFRLVIAGHVQLKYSITLLGRSGRTLSHLYKQSCHRILNVGTL